MLSIFYLVCLDTFIEIRSRLPKKYNPLKYVIHNSEILSRSYFHQVSMTVNNQLEWLDHTHHVTRPLSRPFHVELQSGVVTNLAFVSNIITVPCRRGVVNYHQWTWYIVTLHWFLTVPAQVVTPAFVAVQQLVFQSYLLRNTWPTSIVIVLIPFRPMSNQPDDPDVG